MFYFQSPHCSKTKHSSPLPQTKEYGSSNHSFQPTNRNPLERIAQAQMQYLPLIKADLQLLKASEKEIIDKVIDYMSDWSQNLFSQYVNNDMPLKASKNGEVIGYELVFYRELPYSLKLY
ncbi:hypothetical protein Halhy_2987 [Haliscomenobacter hydrossis DSM 1100]|uniref:Uncharacterized protein n=2 Tax=Haliscomenobacter TaxID=2349 RepID=F4L5I7_HALH1|nr:hypothetical protein Halhy_2987 [Haliscomenobacter hydrossis DSM 1100]